MPPLGDELLRVERGDHGYPARLGRLGGDAPAFLELYGNPELLATDSLAIFCSGLAPGRVVVESFDVARQLAEAGATVAGGFQSPLEREVMDCLLDARASIVACPARTLRNSRLPPRWRSAVEQGRMLVVSAFDQRGRRPTAALAVRRNRIAAAISAEVLVLHATSGGRLERLAGQVAQWGIPLHCIDHPANGDLRLLGARPWPRTRVS